MSTPRPALRPTLSELVAPAQTVVLTVEMQRGVIGDQVSGHGRRSVAGGGGQSRHGGTHDRAATCRPGCRSSRRARDYQPARRPGGPIDQHRMMAGIVRNPDQMLEGTPAVELIPELELSPADIVMNRVHGLTPFGGTELDAILRNLGTRTLIPFGVSSMWRSLAPAWPPLTSATSPWCRPTPWSAFRSRTRPTC